MLRCGKTESVGVNVPVIGRLISSIIGLKILHIDLQKTLAGLDLKP